MIKLILLGLLAGAFFSSTFVLNELMSAAGGHWFWSASLRYLFMGLIITAIIVMQYGFGRIKALMHIFYQHWGFWCLTGTIGFGIFYTGICYAADHVAGWVVASTFMFTVVASLLVLLAFGQRFDKKFIAYALLVFVGVVLVNVSEGMHAAEIADVASTSSISMTDMLLFGALPALIAAFSYPIGNQLVWQASFNAKRWRTEETQARQNVTDSTEGLPLVTEALILPAVSRAEANQGNLNIDTTPSTSFGSRAMQPQTKMQRLIARIPAIQTDLLQNAFNKVWLMTLGSLPFWLVLGVVIHPELPDSSQIFNTLLVALLAGVAATSIFLYAREQAQTSSEVAGVDSTQASEVIFALIGGMILLNNVLPPMMGLIGIVLIIIGLILFAKDG